MDPGSPLDRALASIILDSAAALRATQTTLAQPEATPALRAMAHLIEALVAVREGTVDQYQQSMAQAEAACALDGPARLAALRDHVRAQLHRREGRLSEAEALLAPLHQRAEQRPLVDAYLSAASLATVVSMLGDDDGALDLYYQAMALARRSGVDSLVVNALNNLGAYQSDLYNLEDAAPLLQECLEGALRLGSRRQIIYAAGNLVENLCFRGEAADALALAREHLIGRIRPDDPPALQRDEEIARALLDNDLHDEAAAVLARQHHEDPFSNETATVRVLLQARLLLIRGEPAQALRLCLARQALLDEQGAEGTLPMDQVNLPRVAARAAQAVGELAQACALHERAFAIHEQLLGRAARSRRLSLQITHRLSLAEWERDAARREHERLAALNAQLQAQVAENERLQQRLRAQALEDPLTGVHNRRHLLEAGPAMLSQAQRRQEPLALVMVDLDHFKRVNDQHGHELGDQVLRLFAQLARRRSRAEDLVCRYGGEEFVLLMAGADATQAAERLRALLQDFQTQAFAGADGAVLHCSFSAGVAASGPTGENLHELLAQADAALYRAKQLGRCRVELAVAEVGVG
ncbi:GGDEF domain-containing protein [Ideonella alba]|uniref:diguanylate cyclase n=1 Tax=Ideonella alba TaxID=2824118 RepID=A0A940YEB8_9BURK|nr:GGDEF domain-containing protein [Ideonella alba]MBQ0931601.1 GGDEF domain-containing protein [Ideonella alba]